MHMVHLVHISSSWELLQLSFKHSPAIVLFTDPRSSVGWVGVCVLVKGPFFCALLLRFVMQLRSKPCRLPASRFKAVFHSNC